jgi:hypothetical protein
MTEALATNPLNDREFQDWMEEVELKTRVEAVGKLPYRKRNTKYYAGLYNPLMEEALGGENFGYVRSRRDIVKSIYGLVDYATIACLNSDLCYYRAKRLLPEDFFDIYGVGLARGVGGFRLPSESALLFTHIIWSAPDHRLPYDELAAKRYGKDDESTRSSVRANLANLKDVLEGTRVKITNPNSRGYKGVAQLTW